MGGKTATSTSQTTIPPEVLARYNAVNKMAESAASKPYQSFGTQASDYIAQMNQQQNTGINSVNAAAGSYQPYLDAATGATRAGMGSSIDNIQKYMSPYLTNVADTTSALMRQSNEQAQSGALGAAASSGAFGGDRAGIAAANLAGQNQLAMGKTMADIYNQGYGQAASLSQADLARQLQGGAQMAGLGAQAQGLGLQGAQAQLAAGTMQQQTEQAGKDAMINRFMQEQGYPFQTAQFLANIALGTGVASGTTTTAERPVGFFQRLATGGRANEYADGGGVAGPMQHSQSGVGSQGYVPAGVLPVGDLMISQLPQEEQRSGLEDVMKIASMFMGGKAHGGAAVGRHGYADGGSPIPGARNDNLPSGLVPQPDRISSPISYGVRKTEWNPIMTTSGGSPVAYEYDERTGMVRNPATRQYVTNNVTTDRNDLSNLLKVSRGNDLDFARRTISSQQIENRYKLEREAEEAERLYKQAAKAAADAGSIQLASEQFPDLFNEATRTRNAARSAISSPIITQSSYVPPSENAIQLSLMDRNGGGGDRMPVTSAATGLGGPGTFPAAGMPPAAAPAGLGGPGTFPAAGMPQGGLAPTTSMRPAPRPAGLAGAGIVEIPVADTTAYGVDAKSVPDVRPAVSTSPRADTGERLEGGYTSIVPLTTQLNFTLHELGKPEYSGYLQGNFRTPSEAAVAFEKIYERAGGAGNKEAASYAEGIHAAAMSGDMSGLPPNVVTSYNHFVENGMDPIQAAGAVGRFMVESYPSLNTNARNTMGGGKGTYGVAQWRGSRMEELAEFAGVPLDALTNAPVSTPEGRYYSTGVAGGDSVSGLAGGADQTQTQPGGLGGPRKAYEDRNFIGKFLHDPSTGKLNKDAVMSILSGLGSMVQSTSMSPLVGLLEGAGAGAATYSQLEQRAADIAQTEATTRQTDIAADKGRIYEGQNGTMFINLGGGMPPIELWRYLENPAAYPTGDRQLDAQILRQAQAASVNAPSADGVFASPVIQTLLGRETENAQRNPNAAIAQSAPIEAAVNASAAVARSSIPSILTQADAVAAIVSPDAAVRAGALGSLKQTVANYLNDLSQTVNQMTGVQLPIITDPNGGDAATNAQIILKEAVASGMLNASGIQELQQIMGAQPNVELSAEANSALMAGLLVSGRTDMRRADFMRNYKAQPGNTYRTVIDADQAFQETYGDQVVAEKAALKEIIHYGNQPMPPEWAAILGNYKTPMEFLMTPGIPVAAKNEFISKLLPALGMNDLVISALQGPDGMYIGNYFGG